MKSISNKCIPLELTKKMGEKYPGCWDMIEMMREGKETGKLPSWDDICYVPIAATFPITSHGKEEEVLSFRNLEAIIDAGMLAALAPWRLYKQIFEFATETEEILFYQASDCAIPIEVLRNLPYPCIYIKIKTMTDVDGAFVFIENDMNTNRLELRIMVVENDGDYILPIVIHLTPGGTIKDGIEEMKKEANRVKNELGLDRLVISKYRMNKESTEFIVNYASLIVQLILYICAQNKEVELDADQEKIYKAPASEKYVKDRYSEIRKYNCGETIAKQIRGTYGKNVVSITYMKQKSSEQGSTKRPHVRRGHWHHYWTGRGEKKELILKWQSPTFIHPEAYNDEDVKINDVKMNQDNDKDK